METNKPKNRLIPACAMFLSSSLVMSAMITSVKTVAVYDEGQKTVVYTASADPARAVKLAGLELAADDEIQCLDDIADGFGAVQVNRAFPVTITADGRTHMLRTTGGSVSSILSDAGIALSEQDAVYPALHETVAEGDDITVRRVVVRTEEVKESLPYETKTVETSAIPYGQSRVATAGVAGEKTTSYRVEYHDGEEYSRTSLGTEITRQPVTEVIEKGTGGMIEYNGTQYTYSQVFSMKATAYTTEGKSRKRTASGTVARVGAVAVDPSVIPLGSRLLIQGANGKWAYGVAVAEDTGVKGNKIDLFFNTYRECVSFGVRNATVYVLN